eukprot:1200114-Pyramimonas_sp.AAC.1
MSRDRTIYINVNNMNETNRDIDHHAVACHCTHIRNTYRPRFARSSSLESQLAVRCREVGESCGEDFNPNTLREHAVNSPSLSTEVARRRTTRARGAVWEVEAGETSPGA